jgi:hypothetical protein
MRAITGEKGEGLDSENGNGSWRRDGQGMLWLCYLLKGKRRSDAKNGRRREVSYRNGVLER